MLQANASIRRLRTPLRYVLLIGAMGSSTIAMAENYSQPQQASKVDDREVYIITSRIRGWVPKVGALIHTSIAICPKGVSPIVCENGEPVTNSRHCVIYGTQTNRRGFFREGKRVGVRATKLCGVCASEIERRICAHSQLNIPLFNDCRHHAIAVTRMRGSLFRRKLPLFLR